MLPRDVLTIGMNGPAMIETKSGETYNGLLSSCDYFMNVRLRDVICTSKDGSQFFSIPEVAIRGQAIRYFRLPDTVGETVKSRSAEEREQSRAYANRMEGSHQYNRGDRPSRSDNYRGNSGDNSQQNTRVERGGFRGGHRGGHRGGRGGGGNRNNPNPNRSNNSESAPAPPLPK